MRRVYHDVDGAADFLNCSWVLSHCLSEDDETCWCEAVAYVHCPLCSDYENIFCSACFGTGFARLDEVDDLVDGDEPILLLHNDR